MVVILGMVAIGQGTVVGVPITEDVHIIEDVPITGGDTNG